MIEKLPGIVLRDQTYEVFGTVLYGEEGVSRR